MYARFIVRVCSAEISMYLCGSYRLSWKRAITLKKIEEIVEYRIGCHGNEVNFIFVCEFL